MPVATINVGAVATYDEWTLDAGADKVVAVNLPDDDAATHISTGTNNRQSYTLTPSEIPGMSGVSLVSVVARTLSSVNTNYNGRVKTAAGELDSAAHVGIASYQTIQDDFASKPGGGDWTPGLISLVEIAVVRNSAGSDTVTCTTLSAQVTYLPSGGFVCLIGQWLGPIIALGLDQMPRVAAEIHARNRVLITPDEYKQAWQELREARYPVRFLAPPLGWR